MGRVYPYIISKSSLVLILSIVCTVVFAQNEGFRARLDSNQILIGDQLILHLELQQNPQDKAAFPVFGDTLIKNIEIIRVFPVDTSYISPNSFVLKQDLLITCFDSGNYVVPSMKGLHTRPDGTVDTVFSNPFFLQVYTMQVDTTQNAIADIKVPFEAPWTFEEFLKEYYPHLIAGFILLLLAAFTIWYLKRRRKGQPIIRKIEKPKEPAHVIAFRMLEELKGKKLWQQDLIKEYHSELTEIIRIYLQDRFGIDAMEKTSLETLDSVKNTGLVSTEAIENLSRMLYIADLAKFAKAQPLPDENDNSLKFAFQFVEKTMLFIQPLNENGTQTSDKKLANNEIDDPHFDYAQ